MKRAPYRAVIAVATIFAINSDCLAWADENIVPLAENGSWNAMAHHPSMLAPPDVCVATSQVNESQNFIFRASVTGNEIRLVDRRWTLPTGVEGTIKIAVGAWTGAFDVSANTADMVDAEISKEDLLAMLTAMDKSSTMTVIIGKTKPIGVSLSGSTTVTNAFLTCAGIKGGVKAPGANPFQ
jgi:hypothetical protein